MQLSTQNKFSRSLKGLGDDIQVTPNPLGTTTIPYIDYFSTQPTLTNTGTVSATLPSVSPIIASSAAAPVVAPAPTPGTSITSAAENLFNAIFGINPTPAPVVAAKPAPASAIPATIGGISTPLLLGGGLLLFLFGKKK